MEDCLFCNIVKNELPAWIIYEDELTLAFLDINPNADGHTLVIPKKHVATFMDADLETISAVTKTKKKVAALLAAKLKPKGFNFVINNGSEAFQEIPHYHEHVIPKYLKSEGYAPKIQKAKLHAVESTYQKINKNL